MAHPCAECNGPCDCVPGDDDPKNCTLCLDCAEKYDADEGEYFDNEDPEFDEDEDVEDFA